MAMQLLDLIERDVVLRRVSRTSGGEYAGPCPFCGGTDRFRVWPASDTPGYWCRQCGAHGDAIQYLRDKDGLSYRQACAYLGIPPGERPRAEAAEERPIVLEQDPPSQIWQDRATAFCKYAVEKLWSAEGAEMLAYLHRRGLQDATIRSAGLGFNPGEIKDRPAHWGLESERAIKLPAGLVIPGVVSGVVWRVNIRRNEGEPRYWAVQGSISILYHAHLLSKERLALLLESELDALLVLQEAGDLVTPIASSGTHGGRHNHWLLYLATPRQVLVSTDADDEGDKAADWWQEHLPHARRWRPLVKDPTDMQRLGLSIREWIEDALSAAPVIITAPAMPAPIPPPAPALKVIPGNPSAPRVYIDPNSQANLKAVQPLRWQVMLNCLPPNWRKEEIAIKAAKAYCEADEPLIAILSRPDATAQSEYRGVKLWTALGSALSADDTARLYALAVLGRLAKIVNMEHSRNARMAR